MTKQILSSFFLKDNLKLIKKIERILVTSFGPLGRFSLFLNSNKELKFLIKADTVIQALISKKENKLVIKLIQYLIQKNEQCSGDFSTSIILFFCYLLEDSFLFLESGYQGIILSKGIQKISFFFTELIFNKSISIKTKKELKSIVYTLLSKGVNKELSFFLQNSFNSFKRDGMILIENTTNSSNEIEEIQGLQLDKGFASSYFINDLENFQTVYQNSLLLISSSSLNYISQIESLLSYSEKHNLPLVIITENISKKLLSSIVLLNIKKKLKICVILYNSIKFLKTDILEDLALLTHSSYIKNSSENDALANKQYEIKDLGFINKIIINKNKSCFFISKFLKLSLERKINELSREILLSETKYEKENLQNRIAKLKGNIIKIKIGSNYITPFSEDKKHLEKIPLAIRSTLEEGYVIGGGSFYLYLSEEIKYWSTMNLIGDEIYASKIVINSLKKLFFALYSKEKFGAFLIFQNLVKNGYPLTYNMVEKNNRITFDSILIDPSKNLRLLFLNSFSMLSTLITIN